jgi:predicted ATPase/DNA-binding winged helix-turn-helix (wHTH) protein
MDKKFLFERWLLSIEGRQLQIDGRAAALGRRAIEVLRVLADHADAPVPKRRLMDEVWRGLVVEEGNVAVQVASLRKLLGSDAIMTVPGHGYQLVTRIAGRRGAPSTHFAGLGDAAPVSAGAGVPPHSRAPLIGRDEELPALIHALDRSRLVTVMAGGGVGKSSLAAAAAHALRERWDRGTCWVDLAQVVRAEDLPGRVREALRQHLQLPESTTLACLPACLGCDSLLLVLDNCEHLIDAAVGIVDMLQRMAAGVTVLVTSQVPLRLPHETLFHVGPLCVPSQGANMEEALKSGALVLLMARARAVDHRFELQPRTLPAAIEICRRLEGNAFALELAGSRLPWMGVDAVAARLAQCLRLFSSEHAAQGARHRSLHAMLEWSHRLLGPKEQILFRRLAALPGVFALEEALRVVCDDALPEWDAIDSLGVLVQRSLVRLVHEAHGGLAYRLAETAGLYARELQDAANETYLSMQEYSHLQGRRFAQADEHRGREVHAAAKLAARRVGVVNL